MKMTNRWNQIIYRLWAPIYDQTVGRFFAPGRSRAMEVLDIQPGERVLLLGVGTGEDLPWLPQGVHAVGIDLSAAMLARAQARLPLPGRQIDLILGDAQALMVEDGTFDVVVLSLILSVVPDGAACLASGLRALKPGGRVVIFDKFLADEENISLGRKLLNLGSTFFGTDITRRFCDLATGIDWVVVSNEPSIVSGMYRVILFRKCGLWKSGQITY